MKATTQIKGYIDLLVDMYKSGEINFDTFKKRIYACDKDMQLEIQKLEAEIKELDKMRRYLDEQYEVVELHTNVKA